MTALPSLTASRLPAARWCLLVGKATAALDRRRYRAGMNFGFRLPGPFRVGVSSSGRVSVGASLGPLSASTSVGGSTQSGDVFAPITVDQALAAFVEEGWRVKARGDGWALVGRHMARVRVEAVRGGVVGRRETNPWKVLIWMTLVTAAAFWCMGLTA